MMEKQNLERGWPSPRSWENVSKMCHVCKDKDILRKLVYGLVGNAVGVEFMEFYQMSGKFDDVLMYMLDPSLDIEKTYGKLRDLEMSQRYAITSALVYHLWRGETDADRDRRISGFFRILSKMSSEFATMGCHGAMKGTDRISTEEACEILSESEDYKKFIEKHYDNVHRKVDVRVDLDE